MENRHSKHPISIVVSSILGTTVFAIGAAACTGSESTSIDEEDYGTAEEAIVLSASEIDALDGVEVQGKRVRIDTQIWTGVRAGQSFTIFKKRDPKGEVELRCRCQGSGSGGNCHWGPVTSDDGEDQVVCEGSCNPSGCGILASTDLSIEPADP